MPSAQPHLKWWLWPQVLSLDAPVIAVLWLAALEHTHRLHLPGFFFCGLFVATWVVYALDRTADADASGTQSCHSERHAFHARHRGTVLGLLVPVCVAYLLWSALWQMPQSLVAHGMGLGLLGTIYLACFAAQERSRLQAVLLTVAVVLGVMLVFTMPMPGGRRLAFASALVLAAGGVAKRGTDRRWSVLLPKEVLASLLFVLGTSAGVHFWCDGEHGFFCIETVLLWAVATLNMTGISCAEAAHGLPPANGSVLQHFPRVVAFYPAAALGLAVLAALVLWQARTGAYPPGVDGMAAMTLLAACLLGLLHRFAWSLNPSAYRALADLALLVSLPLVWWLL